MNRVAHDTSLRFTFTELMEAERRNDNGKSDGRLFEALSRWVLCTQAPWANRLKHARFTPPNTPGCDIWGYRPDFTKIDIECKDYFGQTLHLDQIRGLAAQNASGHSKMLFTSANKLSAEVEKLRKAHGITVYARPYFDRLGRDIGGYPSRDEIMAFSGEPVHTDPVKLLPHQAELSDALADELRANGVALLEAPTQTGKTYTLLATIEKLDARRIIWGVPTRAIKDKAVADFSRLPIDDLRIGVVGSEPGNGVTTWLRTETEITDFINDPQPFAIVYVQRSSHKMRNAIHAPVDISVIDEQHHTVGRRKLNWAALEIPATYRIGATATKASLSKKDRALAERQGWEYSTMDGNGGEHHYGKTIRLSPAEARARDLAVPAQLVLSRTDSKDLIEWIERSPKLTTMIQDREISAFDAQTAFVLAQLTDKMGVRKTMFTVNALLAGRGIKRAMPLVTEALGIEPMSGYYIDGATPQATREHRLWEFEHDPQRAFLVQARCMGEGVAIGGLDGVAFVQPRQAQISLIQTFGRAAGQAFGAGAQRKTHYNVYLPIVIGPDETFEQAVEASRFDKIVKVLGHYNDDEAEQLINNVQIVGLPGPKISRRPREPGPDPVFSATPEEIRALKTVVFDGGRRRVPNGMVCQVPCGCTEPAISYQDPRWVCNGHAAQFRRKGTYAPFGWRPIPKGTICQALDDLDAPDCEEKAIVRQGDIIVCREHYGQYGEYKPIRRRSSPGTLERCQALDDQEKVENCSRDAVRRQGGVSVCQTHRAQYQRGCGYTPIKPHTKLTEADARAILDSDDDERVLAERYDVHVDSIRNVRAGRSWKRAA